MEKEWMDEEMDLFGYREPDAFELRETLGEAGAHVRMELIYYLLSAEEKHTSCLNLLRMMPQPFLRFYYSLYADPLGVVMPSVQIAIHSRIVDTLGPDRAAYQALLEVVELSDCISDRYLCFHTQLWEVLKRETRNEEEEDWILFGLLMEDPEEIAMIAEYELGRWQTENTGKLPSMMQMMLFLSAGVSAEVILERIDFSEIGTYGKMEKQEEGVLECLGMMLSQSVVAFDWDVPQGKEYFRVFLKLACRSPHWASQFVKLWKEDLHACMQTWDSLEEMTDGMIPIGEMLVGLMTADEAPRLTWMEEIALLDRSLYAGYLQPVMAAFLEISCEIIACEYTAESMQNSLQKMTLAGLLIRMDQCIRSRGSILMDGLDGCRSDGEDAFLGAIDRLQSEAFRGELVQYILREAEEGRQSERIDDAWQNEFIALVKWALKQTDLPDYAYLKDAMLALVTSIPLCQNAKLLPMLLEASWDDIWDPVLAYLAEKAGDLPQGMDMYDQNRAETEVVRYALEEIAKKMRFPLFPYCPAPQQMETLLFVVERAVGCPDELCRRAAARTITAMLSSGVEDFEETAPAWSLLLLTLESAADAEIVPELARFWTRVLEEFSDREEKNPNAFCWSPQSLVLEEKETIPPARYRRKRSDWSLLEELRREMKDEMYL